MDRVGGLIYSGGAIFEGYVEFEGGVIIDVHEGKPPRDIRAEGLILPFMRDCHTHVGDYCLRGRYDADAGLDELFRPPEGFKHATLEACKDSEVIHGMDSAFSEMRRNGISSLIDFREGGMRGLEQLLRAKKDSRFPETTILSRPEGLAYDETEAEALLSRSDGFGLSAVSDWPMGDLISLSQHAKREEKVFSIHASEEKREDIGKVLDLGPDFIVHMASASEEDLIACHDEKTPLVICPRSNARFGIKLDIARMIDIGLAVSLGTDNAMLHNISMIDEMRAAYNGRFNSRPLTPMDILKLAIDNSQKVLKNKTMISIAPGSRSEFIVVRAGDKIDPEAILSEELSYSIEFNSLGSQI